MTTYNLARALLRDATRAFVRGSTSTVKFGPACGVGKSSCDGQSPPSDRFKTHFHLFSSVAEVGESSSKQLPNGSSKDNDAPHEASKDSVLPRRRISEVTISEVLKRKHSLHWVEPVISTDATVSEAITMCIEHSLNGMMVMDRSDTMTGNTTTELKQKCVGLWTTRDLLRMIASSIKDGKSSENLLNAKVNKQMTPINQVIYGRPDETIGTCRAIMAKLGIKCLPIISEGRVEGILTGRDMSDFFLDATDRGGKQNYLRDVCDRVGLTTDTSMAEPPVFVRQYLALDHAPVYLNVGVAESPHPYKSVDGIGGSRRNFGPQHLATDTDLSEDAHFVSQVELFDDSGTNLQKMLYMGVADGVGSWREYGVDPRNFSHKLMGECENVLHEAQCGAHGGKRSTLLSPAELMAQAYEITKEADVIGSATVCVALFDSVHHALHFSNIGDSGIIVLRHIDSEVTSPLQRNRFTPRVERKSDLSIAFVSQQQLRSFNHPFQMGWTGEEIVEKNSSFRQASDSCTSSVHIIRGDIIIMATDGLFDNVDINDIASIAFQWEQGSGFIDGGGATSRNKRWASGNSLTDISAQSIPKLAEMLCQKARENSLNTAVDSPFAMLAKENDIMWSGGMPDDCTVVAMHVVGEPTNRGLSGGAGDDGESL